MLKMDEYEYIRTAHRIYGKNICQIAKDTGHSRATIRKILNSELTTYKTRSKQSFPVIQPYIQTIDRWLLEDQKLPKKQRHTSHRIYFRLVNEFQFQGSESNLRKYIKKAKIRLGIHKSRAFIPLQPDVGREAEVDWGEAQVFLNNQKQKVKYFCIRSKYSGKHFLRLYLMERQQAFFDAHIHAFQFFGGIFPTLIYDNLTVAVKKVFQGRKRLEQEAFQKFKAYYNFEARFCNPAKGHEKGGVEGMVGFVRRNYMVPIPCADSLEQLNENMLKQCLNYGEHRIYTSSETVDENFEKEKSHLIALPAIPFSNVQTFSARTDKYATVMVEQNRYSVPTNYASLKVEVLRYVGVIEIYYKSKKLASHERSYGKHEWKICPTHYLNLIQQRPQSFHSARPIRQWKKEWPECMERLLSKFCDSNGEAKGIKEFLSVLMLVNEHGYPELYAAVELAVQYHISNSEGVRHIILYTSEKAEEKTSLNGWPTFEPPDLSIYEELGGEI